MVNSQMQIGHESRELGREAKKVALWPPRSHHRVKFEIGNKFEKILSFLKRKFLSESKRIFRGVTIIHTKTRVRLVIFQTFPTIFENSESCTNTR